jgi:hypothetical protein
MGGIDIRKGLLIVLALIGVSMAAMSFTASAQLLGTNYAYVPGSGISDTTTWTTSAGGATSADSFGSSVTGLLCDPFFSSFGWGPVSAGGNVGVQSSAANTFSRSTDFGLPPFTSVYFGL